MKISPETWKRVDPLFTAALGLAPDERAPWLAGLRERQPDLAPIVEELLAAHDEVERTTGTETVPRLAALPPGDTFAAGEILGPFRLVRPLGRGGMGEVWLAEQADGRIERKVALKLPTFFEAGGARAERFRRERDILAKLEHPNIARLYDAGVTDRGQPWLAMEFVEGWPLDAYVAERHLDVPARLALMRQVMAAVAHAHRFLVVHRDLKPANILVDATGRVRLLDFGIAKLLDEETRADSSNEDLTRMGGRVLTLRYAAPEQATEGAITTATDVYALGVILHELLTGASPYRAVRDGRALAQVAVAQEHIARPSSLPLADAAARERGFANARQLARALSGDLDAIVLKALRRDPADRYASVEQFDEDLRRHLESLPVTAREGTRRYLAGRFVARHRLALVTAAVVVAAALTGGVTVERERRIALAQKDRAERHLKSVRQLANALMFDVHDRIRDLPGATQARQALVENASRYLAQLEPEAGDDPDFRRELADAYLRLGNILGAYNAPNIGKSQEALESYDRAIALLAPAVRSRESRVAEAARELLVRVQRQKGQLLDAVDRITESVAVFREGVTLAESFATVPGATPLQRLDHAVMLVEYTWRLSRQGVPRIRLQGLEQGLGIAREVSRSLPADAPESLRNRAQDDIAWMSSGMGHYLRGSDDPADMRRAVGLFGEALAIREAAARRSPLEVRHQRSIFVHHTYIGLTLADLGEATEGLPHLQKAAEGLEGLSAADPGNAQYRRDAYYARVSLATVEVAARRYDDSLASAQRARDHRAALPDAMRRTTSLLDTEARLLMAEGEARMRLASGLPRGEREVLLARAKESFLAAGQVLAEAEGKGEKAADSAPAKRRLSRLLAEVDAAQRSGRPG